jgi:hypothetical protein
MPRDEIYAPPSGPPPSYISPPNHASSQESEYAPPPGPPPSHSEYLPPPGPPPSHIEPYHDWQTAVPDTSLLPPPPSLGNQRSSTNNATEIEAEQGEQWCRQYPLIGPVYLSSQAQSALQTGEVGLMVPRTYRGKLDRISPGVWGGHTLRNSPDSCIISTAPLYSVHAHSPMIKGTPKTAYYEVKIARSNRKEVSLALGFAAPPYPTFRLPGWHRGCLAVHGDDGSKFINDRWGGKDFTSPFKPGETVGIGMTFTKRNMDAAPSQGRAQTQVQTPINVEIFLTRNGKKTGGWNLHEEGDSVEDLPVTGLEGFHDLFAAVGTFEEVDFVIVFREQDWMYRP